MAPEGWHFNASRSNPVAGSGGGFQIYALFGAPLVMLVGVLAATLSSLINRKTALTAETALRIHRAFGPDVDHLLRMQVAYDAAQIRKRSKAIKVKCYFSDICCISGAE
jgi:addiction module HigA family antidote